MARSVEVDVFGIARGILPAKVADMPGGNILTFIDRHVGHISQIERRREHERLCPCDAPAVAFRHTHQFLPLGIVTVNALGDVFDLDTGRQIGGLLSEDKKYLCNSEELMYRKYSADKNYFAGNTTIGCIVTNAKLDKTQMMKIASMAHDGMARTIRPVHTWADGDSVFAMATGEVTADANAVGTLAARVMGYAINRGVQKASSEYGLICASQL